MNRNIEKLRPKMRMVHWNKDGFKTGFAPRANVCASLLLSLSNNCCIGETFDNILSKFHRIYRRKAHTHHYTQFMEGELFDSAAERVQQLIDDYARLSRGPNEPTGKRLIPVI